MTTQLRSRFARALVRWVSRWYEAAHRANERGTPHWENLWVVGADRAERLGLRLALRLDRDAAGAQMAEEGWWG